MDAANVGYHRPDPATLAAMGTFFAVFGIFTLALFMLGIVIQWRIAAKAGYPGALSLLMLVPVVNVVMLCLFAFSEWPIERMVKGSRGGPGPQLFYPANPAYPPSPPDSPYLPPSV